jgi:hypothetical protein
MGKFGGPAQRNFPAGGNKNSLLHPKLCSRNATAERRRVRPGFARTADGTVQLHVGMSHGQRIRRRASMKMMAFERQHARRPARGSSMIVIRNSTTSNGTRRWGLDGRNLKRRSRPTPRKWPFSARRRHSQRRVILLCGPMQARFLGDRQACTPIFHTLQDSGGEKASFF